MPPDPRKQAAVEGQPGTWWRWGEGAWSPSEGVNIPGLAGVLPEGQESVSSTGRVGGSWAVGTKELKGVTQGSASERIWSCDQEATWAWYDKQRQ